MALRVTMPMRTDVYKRHGLILNFFQQETYIDKWPQEFLQIYVDEDGISGFEWRNPLAVSYTHLI